ncbi:hypothetical protein [Thermopirellula anaerolimosa]
MLWWLPEETETILVSRGAVPIPELCHASPAAEARGVPFLPSAQGFAYSKCEYPYEDLVAMHCIEPLVYNQGIYPPDIRHKLISTFYAAKSAILFTKAVCWLRAGSPDTCDIVQFCDHRAVPLVEALTRGPSKWWIEGGMKIVEVSLNHNASMVFGKRSQDALAPQEADRRWIAAPRPDVYVCTTSLDLMKLIIARMQQRGLTRALPASLPEWEYVDPDWPAWAVRHYRFAVKGSSASSMLKWDPEAVGLVFFGGTDPKPYLALRYLSHSEQGGLRILRMQCDYWGIPFEGEYVRHLPAWRRIANGCFESRTRINVPREELQERPIENLKNLPVDITFFFSMDSIYLPWLGFPSARVPIPATMMQPR